MSFLNKQKLLVNIRMDIINAYKRNCEKVLQVKIDHELTFDDHIFCIMQKNSCSCEDDTLSIFQRDVLL